MLPGGKARAEKLTTLDVGEGANAQTITGWAITGVSNSPIPVWTDAKGKFFGFDFGLAGCPRLRGHAEAHRKSAGRRARQRRSPALARSLARTPTAPVAFTDVRLYDADARRFLADQTVVVDKGRIVAVGSGRSDEGAGRRQAHRRPRQDAGARAVGLPHARRRRLHRLAGTLDGRHLGARSRQQRHATIDRARTRGQGRAAVAAMSIRRR